MLGVVERDLSIVNDENYFGKVATEIGTSSVIRLPGIDIKPKADRIRRGVNGARSRSGATILEEISLATYAEDTCRSLFRVTKTGVLIPLDEGDTVESMKARTSDYVEEIFEVAERERIPLSGHRRSKGFDELREEFRYGESGTVLNLAVLAGNNSGRKVDFWFSQLDNTTRGLSRIPKKAVDAFIGYALSRPIKYDEKRDIIQGLADIRSHALEQTK